MTSLEYYIEQIKQFISALTDDIESGYGTVVTQTKLAVYREVLKHLEEIEQEQSYNSINPELNGDMISRQEVFKIIEDIRDCVSVTGYWVFLERLKKLPPVNPQPCDDAISRQAVLDEAFEVDTKEYGRIEVVGVDAINSLPPVTPQPKWIPVNEELPEEGKEVLTCSNGGFIEIQSLEDSCADIYWENCNGDWSDIDEVIAWMPLPTPYDSQERNDKE